MRRAPQCRSVMNRALKLRGGHDRPQHFQGGDGRTNSKGLIEAPGPSYICGVFLSSSLLQPTHYAATLLSLSLFLLFFFPKKIFYKIERKESDNGREAERQGC